MGQGSHWNRGHGLYSKDLIPTKKQNCKFLENYLAGTQSHGGLFGSDDFPVFQGWRIFRFQKFLWVNPWGNSDGQAYLYLPETNIV